MSQGKFLNPNDLAQAILFGLPGWWLIMKRSRSPVMRLVAFASVVVIMVTFTKTASRGGFTGPVVLILVCFWRSSSSGNDRDDGGGAVVGSQNRALRENSKKPPIGGDLSVLPFLGLLASGLRS
jgi:hypothetical protein